MAARPPPHPFSPLGDVVRDIRRAIDRISGDHRLAGWPGRLAASAADGAGGRRNSGAAAAASQHQWSVVHNVVGIDTRPPEFEDPFVVAWPTPASSISSVDDVASSEHASSRDPAAVDGPALPSIRRAPSSSASSRAAPAFESGGSSSDDDGSESEDQHESEHSGSGESGPGPSQLLLSLAVQAVTLVCLGAWTAVGVHAVLESRTDSGGCAPCAATAGPVWSLLRRHVLS